MPIRIVGVGLPDTAIDIPLAHKDALYVRSHYDAMEVRLPDAPLPDEIVVFVVLASGARLNARVGGLRADEIEGKDGLRQSVTPQTARGWPNPAWEIAMNCRAHGFILILILGIVALPPLAEAQQAGKVPRIGLLFYGSPGPSPELDAFRQGLRELGYIEGQNIAIEYRFASGRVERLPELATELVRLKLDVIVTPATPASLAAKQATSTIPIVFAAVADAVGAGLVANFARPGGNITRLTSISAELGGKRLELLKEVAPKPSRVAVLYNPADRANVLVLKELQESAPALGLTLQPLEVRGPGEFEAAFVAMTRERTHALFGAAGILTFEHRNAIVDLAAKRRMPAM